MRKLLPAVLIFCVTAQVMADDVDSASPPPLAFKSPDKKLNDAFSWAQRQARDYVFYNDPVGPWYEAALPGREAFCMRDVSHQAMGAQALGLQNVTKNMLRKFAAAISPSRDWCSYWEIDRYDRPALVDYKNDQEFWFNLPANFDVMDCCYRMYLWTGDTDYLQDPVFTNFYDKTVHEYVDAWDLGIDKIMKRQRHMHVDEAGSDEKKKFGFNRGIPGYQESNATYIVSLDVLCSQYAAYRAYSRIKDVSGDRQTAAEFAKKAADLRELIHTQWWNNGTNTFYGRVNKDYVLEGTGGMELLYWNVAEDGPKLQSAVDVLLQHIEQNPVAGVEGLSHHAEVLYRYGHPDVAYQQMLALADPHYKRKEYPEGSYSVVGAMVTGTMGITVEPSSPAESETEGNYVDRAVKTLSGLTKETAWAELQHLPIRANIVSVRHEGAKTTFTNEHGPSLIWQAEFAGEFDNLLVDGEPLKAKVGKGYLNKTTTSIRVPVGAGDTVTVEAPSR